MTVKEIIENHGREYLIELIEENRSVFVVQLGNVVTEKKLTGISHRNGFTLFEISYFFHTPHIFLSEEDALKHIERKKDKI